MARTLRAFSSQTVAQIAPRASECGGDHVGQLLVQPLEQQRLGLLAVEAGDLVQLLGLLLDQVLDLRSCACRSRPGVPLSLRWVCSRLFAFFCSSGSFLPDCLRACRGGFPVAADSVRICSISRLSSSRLLIQVVLGFEFGFLANLVGFELGVASDFLDLGLHAQQGDRWRVRVTIKPMARPTLRAARQLRAMTASCCSPVMTAAPSMRDRAGRRPGTTAAREKTPAGAMRWL